MKNTQHTASVNMDEKSVAPDQLATFGYNILAHRIS